MLLVAGICVLSMTAAEEVGMLDSVPSSPSLSIGGDMKREEESLLQVTPQIPDGPVVAKFKKMKAKKKLDKQIVTQSKVMKPMLKRKKVKKKAQKNKMGMLADLEIKKRKTKNELKLKKLAMDNEKKKKSTFARAKKRRLERYQKYNFDKFESKKERIQKLGKNMQGAKNLVERLRKAQGRRAKEMAAKFTAKIKANNKEEMKVGGMIHLKGLQINNKALVDLNKKLATANKYPTNQNIRMSKMVFAHAAMMVAKEKERFDAFRRKQKELKAKRVERGVKFRKDKKVKKVTELINKERRQKVQRQEKMRKHTANGKEKNNKSWAAARNKVISARAAISRAERTAKNRMNAVHRARAAEKARKAPMEAYNKAKATVKERGRKLQKAKKPSAKFIAKTMKERAVKLMKEKGGKARVKVPARRRRVDVRRRRARSTYVRNSQIKLRAGVCLDASQRNRSGGKVHLWPCNTRNWNQQWNYNTVTGLIQNSHGICLDASQRNRNGGKVHMWGCNSRNANQKWYYNPSNGSIKNRYGICLATPNSSHRNRSGGRVWMYRCLYGNANQKWYMSGYRL